MTDRQGLVMSRVEVAAFLDQHRVAMVAGRDAGGRLFARRAVVALVAADELQVELCDPEGPFDLGANPELCIVVDTYPSPKTIQGVVLQGTGAWGSAQTIVVRVERTTSFDFNKVASRSSAFGGTAKEPAGS